MAAERHRGRYNGRTMPRRANAFVPPLVRFRELQGMDELYDLEADPHEAANLMARPEGRALLPRLQAELDRLLAATK